MRVLKRLWVSVHSVTTHKASMRVSTSRKAAIEERAPFADIYGDKRATALKVECSVGGDFAWVAQLDECAEFRVVIL